MSNMRKTIPYKKKITKDNPIGVVIYIIIYEINKKVDPIRSTFRFYNYVTIYKLIT